MDLNFFQQVLSNSICESWTIIFGLPPLKNTIAYNFLLITKIQQKNLKILKIIEICAQSHIFFNCSYLAFKCHLNENNHSDIFVMKIILVPNLSPSHRVRMRLDICTVISPPRQNSRVMYSAKDVE